MEKISEYEISATMIMDEFLENLKKECCISSFEINNCVYVENDEQCIINYTYKPICPDRAITIDFVV